MVIHIPIRYSIVTHLSEDGIQGASSFVPSLASFHDYPMKGVSLYQSRCSSFFTSDNTDSRGDSDEEGVSFSNSGWNTLFGTCNLLTSPTAKVCDLPNAIRVDETPVVFKGGGETPFIG